MTFRVAIKESIDNRYKKADAGLSDRVKDAKGDIEDDTTTATADLKRTKADIQPAASEELNRARQDIGEDKAAADNDLERAENIQEDKAVATSDLKRIENFQEDKAAAARYLKHTVNNGKNSIKSANVSIHKTSM